MCVLELHTYTERPVFGHKNTNNTKAQYKSTHTKYVCISGVEPDPLEAFWAFSIDGWQLSMIESILIMSAAGILCIPLCCICTYWMDVVKSIFPYELKSVTLTFVRAVILIFLGRCRCFRLRYKHTIHAIYGILPRFGKVFWLCAFLGMLQRYKIMGWVTVYVLWQLVTVMCEVNGSVRY